MEWKSTALSDVWIIEPTLFHDDRGYFFESYQEKEFADHGITDQFIQDNHSFSKKNVVRGLHFQKPPFAQSKLVRVIQGEVYDVVVDLRPSSETFGQSFGTTLSAENKKMLYVPKGFAHGFCVISDTAEFVYKCGGIYHKPSESGILWNDPELAIEWPIKAPEAIVSDKDQQLPKFAQVKDSFR